MKVKFLYKILENVVLSSVAKSSAAKRSPKPHIRTVKPLRTYTCIYGGAIQLDYIIR